MAEIKQRGRFSNIPHAKKLTPLDEAVIAKLVRRHDNGTDSALWNRGNKSLPVPDGSTLRQLTNQIARNNADADNLFQILPEMNLAAEIVTSAIISPGDLVETKILYKMSDDNVDSEITGPVLRLIQAHFENEYKIKSVLPDMVYDIMFKRGSYPLMILPESTVDHVINSMDGVSMESVSDIPKQEKLYPNYGILGSGAGAESERSSLESLRTYRPDSAANAGAHTIKVKLDSMGLENIEKTLKDQLFGESFDTNITVIDNPDIVKNPVLIDTLRKRIIGQTFGRARSNVHASMEAANPKYTKRTPLKDVEGVFYRRRDYERTPIQMLLTPRQLDRETVGHPVVVHVNSASVIPVHIPGNPRHHIGYFVPLDKDGNILNVDLGNDYYGDIQSQLNSSTQAASQLMTNTAIAQDGRKNCHFNQLAVSQLTNTYSHLVENDLKNRLRSGAMTGEYELAATPEIMAMMFTRSLRKKQTTFLFVPAELMSYIAVDFNNRGIGKTLIEDGKMLGAIRGIVLFANTMAAMKNATGTQTLRFKIPEKSGDPYADLEYMLNEYGRTNMQGFPFADTHPLDMVTSLQNMGKNIVVENHPAFPDVGMDVEDRPGSFRQIDNEFSDDLKERHIQTFGLTPETMNAAGGAEFATQVITNNFYLIKRSIKVQEILCPQLTEFVRRYTQFSGILRDGISEIIGENPKMPEGIDKREDYIDYLIDCVVIDLPRPETKKVDEQLKAFTDYSDAIAKYLDAYISEEFFDATAAAELHESLASIKAAFLGILQRKWLRENAIATELDVFFTAAEGEGPLWKLEDEMATYTKDTLDGFVPYLKKIWKASSSRAERLRKLKEEMPLEPAVQPFSDDALNDGASDVLPDDDIPNDLDELGELDALSDEEPVVEEEEELEETPPDDANPDEPASKE